MLPFLAACVVGRSFIVWGLMVLTFIMLKLLLGDPNARKLKRYQPIVSDIGLFEDEIAQLSDDDLRSKTFAFQERLAKAGSLETSDPFLMRFCQKLLLSLGGRQTRFRYASF